jgi:hypothetical protein
MRSGPRSTVSNELWLAWWLAVAALSVVLSARPSDALDQADSWPMALAPVTSIEVFRDDFPGVTLAPHWTVLRPDPTAFAVSNGALRVESREPGWIPDETLANLFRLGEPMPLGDWTINVNLKLRLETGAENFFFVLQEDKDHWFGAQIRSVPNKYTGHRLMLAAVEGRDGRIRSSERPLVAIECRVCDSAWMWKGFSEKLIDDQLVALRIAKNGDRYAISGRLAETPGDDWIAIEAIGPKHATGRLAFGLAQSRLPDIRQGAIPGGASSASIDWITIDVPHDPTVIGEGGRPAVAQSVPTR